MADILSYTLRRWLEYSKFEVKQVMNITDVGHLLDDADEGDRRTQPEGAQTDARRGPDQLAALDARALEGVDQGGGGSLALQFRGPTVVAVLDRDLFGDELLRELNGTDADAGEYRLCAGPHVRR